MKDSTNRQLVEDDQFYVPWSPAAALWIFLLQLSLVTLFGMVLVSITADLDSTVQSALLLQVSALAGITMTFLYIWSRYARDLWRLRGPAPPTWRHVSAGIGYGIGAYLLVGAGLGWLLTALVTAGGGELPEVQQSFREFAADPELAPLFLFGAIVLAPVSEELLFRGVLFQSLRARLGVWPGIGLSAIFFGMVHLDPAVTLGGNLLVFTTIFALGMVFAWLFHRTGGIIVPIMAHMVFNAISGVLLVTITS